MTDAADVREVLSADPVMADLLDEHGDLVVEAHDRPFERLVVSIVNQQLSTASAAAIRERLEDRIALTPDGVRDADDEVLRECGLSESKIRYLRNVAAHFPDGVDVDAYAGLPDEDVRADLTSITGVGTWTADMFCIFCLGREDVFPVGDLGVRNGMTALYGHETREEMVEHAAGWAPYRSYATRYVWRAYEG